MNEDLIRQLVRDALARREAGPPDPGARLQPLSFAGHGSHYRYALPKLGSDCVIEPAVQCNHCGYCESHGH